MNDAFRDALFTPLRESSQYRLAAIVELGRLSEQGRERLASKCPGRLWSLLQQSDFKNLLSVSPCLCVPREGASLEGQWDFFWMLNELAMQGICGWIVSKLPAAALLEHLGQANIVRAADGHRYLLRYHTEHSLKVLHARRDLPDIAHWLAPIHSWWVPYPDHQKQSWQCLSGGDLPAGKRLSGLALDQACWHALSGEPLSQRLAEQLKSTLAASGMPARCHGVRLGLAQHHLAQARAAGLTRQADLITYVNCMAIHESTLKTCAAWQHALDQARANTRLLADALAQANIHSLQ